MLEVEAMGIRALSRLAVIVSILTLCISVYSQDPCCAVGGAVTVMDAQKGPDKKWHAVQISSVGVTITVTQDQSITYTVKSDDGVYVLYIPNDKIKKFDLTLAIPDCPRCPPQHDGDSNKIRQNKRDRQTLLTVGYLKLIATKSQVERTRGEYRGVQQAALADGNQALAQSMAQNLRMLELIGRELSNTASQSSASGAQEEETEFLFDRAVMFQEAVEPGSLNLAKTKEAYAGFLQLRQEPSANQRAEKLAMEASAIRAKTNANFDNYFFCYFADFSPFEAAWAIRT